MKYIFTIFFVAVSLAAVEPIKLTGPGEFDFGVVTFHGKTERVKLLTDTGLLFRNSPKGSTAQIEMKNFPAKQGTLSFWVSPVGWDVSDGKFHIFMAIKFSPDAKNSEKTLIIYRYANPDFGSTGLGVCARFSTGDSNNMAVFNLPNNKLGESWKKGSWHNIVLKYDSDNASLYIDDECISMINTSLPFTENASVVLGQDWGDFADTAIDRVIISSNPMTKEEISAEYETGITILEEGK